MPARKQRPTLDDPYHFLVQFARIALTGPPEEVAMLARTTMNALVKRRPDLASEVQGISRLASRSLTRNLSSTPIPVDLESRHELLRIELEPNIDLEPVWTNYVQDELELVIAERKREADLVSSGLFPTRSLLFFGPPGVGKTLAARWLARELKRPLFSLDLASVMSSFLGRTGNNIKSVLNFASQEPAILLLDEFDSIAKRRDDATEIGELKRLVTVILQAVEDWPADGLLIAATNHEEILDPAAWRRFERVIEFPLPGTRELKILLDNLFGHEIPMDLLQILAASLCGRSYSDVINEVRRFRRESIVRSLPASDIPIRIAGRRVKQLDKPSKQKAIKSFLSHGISQRRIANITGLSRTTVSKYGKKTR